DFLGESLGAWGPYASAGFLQRLGDWTTLLLEARYQLDSTQEKELIPEQDYYTWQGLLGLRIALGEKPVDRSLDSDGDGVPDYLDRCPGTPKGVIVGTDGCPLDSDADGVADYLDRCAGTPPGVAVDAEGCPLTVQIKCLDTPRGIPVGPDNCPLDSDGDGIPDYLDECPNTPPGMKILPNGCALQGDCRKPREGEQVDANGCAIEQSFVLRGVKFEFDSDRLTPRAKEILNDVAETLKNYPNINVELEGHTDAIGTDAYNLGLSERRANAVKRYLEDRGIGGARMKPVGYGESQPIATNDTEIGREENRRVELQVIE
ncbi:MAG: OmpA family protein, partial [Gammaproteobacteria bacterium]